MHADDSANGHTLLRDHLTSLAPTNPCAASASAATKLAVVGGARGCRLAESATLAMVMAMPMALAMAMEWSRWP